MVDNSKGIYYNVKRYHYASGSQVRIYSKPLVKGKAKKVIEEIRNSEEMEESLEEKIYKQEKSVRSSMNRTKQSIYGIARANTWEWFLTLTFDRNKVESSDYNLVTKKAVKWLNNLRVRVTPDMRYMLVPELHADGKHWHLHGLIADCKELDFVKTDIVHDGKVVYNLSNWKYGFSTATKVEHSGKVSGYITKYITKELCTFSKGKRRYWASNNCLKPNDVLEIDLLTADEIEKYMYAVSDDIKHIKCTTCQESGQRVKYLEL